MNQLTKIILNPNLTKKQVVEIAENEANQIAEAADQSLLPVIVNLKRAKDYLETFEKGLKKSLLTEALSYSDKSFKAHGARFDVKEVGSRWNYCNCQDPVYNELLEKEKEIAEQRKQREKFLQSIKGHMTVIDEESGEAVTVYAPVKTSETSVAIIY